MKQNVAAQAPLALCALLFCLPLILCIVLRAGFLDLANEPLGYRFFYPEKILAGDVVAIGVGHLVSVLHLAVHATLNLLPDTAGTSLERRMDAFVLLTNGLLSAAMCGLLWIAARSSSLRRTDLALLAMVALVPLYATGGWGLEYALMADYTFLDMVLCTASLLLFQLYWRRPHAASLFEVAAIGAFVGMVCANKPTLLVVAGCALVPVVIASGLGGRTLVLRACLSLCGLVAAFYAVHLAYHFGNVQATNAGLSWLAWYVQNAGSEPGFWEVVRTSMLDYNYAFVAAWGIAALLLAIVGLEVRRKASPRTLMAGTFCMLGLIASVYFVARRPAHSTLFESALFVLVLGAMLLTLVEDWPPARKAILASGAAWAVLALATFPFRGSYELVAGSGERARTKWAAFEEVRRIAGSRPMEVILPDNFYHHEGVFELLVKAASTFPEWKTSPGGRAVVLDRYAPGMSVRYTGGIPGPGAPYAGGRVLVWFDRPGAPALTLQFPELAAAVARAGVKQYQWSVRARGGLVYPAGSGEFTMRAAEIPDPT